MNDNISLLFWSFVVCVVHVCNGSVLNPNAKVLTNHHTNEQVFELMMQVNAKCPTITHVYDLVLKSVNGQPLKVIAFSDNPKVHEEGEPEFKYVGNMHGNEVIGREILLELMVQLCDAYLAKQSNVVKLIDSTRIHMLITMNPDGWDIAVNKEYRELKNSYKSIEEMLYEHGVVNWLNGRKNANDVDLNRNFPDLDKYEYAYTRHNKFKFDHLVKEASQEINEHHLDCQGQKFQPETLTVANWIVNNPFVLSANLHGGDLVVNYPYDDSEDHRTEYAATPDNDLFVDISESFAHYHKNMSSPNRKKCDMASDLFQNGITNGAHWYPVCGGMQDFNYLSSNCFEVTIELGCQKFPPGKTLAQYWKDNMDAFYQFMWLSHIGIKGVVLDENNEPVPNARILVKREATREDFSNGARIDREGYVLIKHIVHTTSEGEYWRLLTSGKYKVYATDGNGRSTHELSVEVKNNAYEPALELNLKFKRPLDKHQFFNLRSMLMDENE